MQEKRTSCRAEFTLWELFNQLFMATHTVKRASKSRPKILWVFFFFLASDLTNGERVNVQRQKPARHQKQILPPDGGESRRKVQNHDACAKEALLSCMSGSTVPSLMGNKLFDTTLCAFFFPPISIYEKIQRTRRWIQRGGQPLATFSWCGPVDE